MRDFCFRTIKGVFRSRVGYFLGIVNILYFIVVFWEKGLPIEGIHPFNETLLTQIFLVINLPAMILALLMSGPLIAFGIGIQRAETMYLLCFIGIFVQWQLLGYVVQRMFLSESD